MLQYYVIIIIIHDSSNLRDKMFKYLPRIAMINHRLKNDNYQDVLTCTMIYYVIVIIFVTKVLIVVLIQLLMHRVIEMNQLFVNEQFIIQFGANS
uniref:Uncharacterized protein n=1 Tax=Lepeophtheirus salmonis TaxID=72036 RepID=A0A0K2V7H3_LEPSM